MCSTPLEFNTRSISDAKPASSLCYGHSYNSVTCFRMNNSKIEKVTGKLAWTVDGEDSCESPLVSLQDCVNIWID